MPFGLAERPVDMPSRHASPYSLPYATAHVCGVLSPALPAPQARAALFAPVRSLQADSIRRRSISSIASGFDPDIFHRKIPSLLHIPNIFRIFAPSLGF